MEEIKSEIVLALEESIEILRTENSSLRNQNRILRTVFRSLRDANESLRRMVEIARQNDEMFKSYCQGEFDAPIESVRMDGLSEKQAPVDPVI